MDKDKTACGYNFNSHSISTSDINEDCSACPCSRTTPHKTTFGFRHHFYICHINRR